LSSLDGTLQLLVLLIADPALTLAALVIKESPVCGELLGSCSASSYLRKGHADIVDKAFQ
jgi:hypothetical protein